MGELLDELMLSAQQLEDARPQFARVLRDSASRRQQLIADTSWRLLPAVVASGDDLFYSIVTGGDEDRSGSRTTDAASVEDVLLYARLALLTQQVDQGYTVLEVATRQTDSAFIATVEENVNLVMHQLRDNLDYFSDTDHEDLDPMLVPLARGLVDAAYGESNLIDLMKTRLRLSDQEAQLAGAVDAASSSLQAEVNAVLEQTIGGLELTGSRRETPVALQAALAVGQHAAAATSRSSARTTANTTPAEAPDIRDAVAADISGIRRGLDTLGDAGYGAAVAHMYSEIDRFESNAERVNDSRPELAAALQSAARERAQLRSFLDYQLEPAVVASLDNQLYYMLTGWSEFSDDGSVDSDPLSHVELMRYRHLASIYTSLFQTFSGLIIAIIMTEPTWIGVGEERFITASHRLEKSIDSLEELGGTELDPQVVPLARQFVGFGSGESNVFDSLRHRLPLIGSESELIEANQQIHSGLQADIDALFDWILQDAVSPAGDSGAGTSSTRTIVLVLGIVAAVITLLVAAFVARRNVW
ncbi:MAG: hypothetical protein OXS29_11010 [bacterium]|nr:hypothetical protein [bacterium]MDE0290747.1 hypothetical protein [bacterium]MDE0440051.1 hypothetical protein [bacterium]